MLAGGRFGGTGPPMWGLWTLTSHLLTVPTQAQGTHCPLRNRSITLTAPHAHSRSSPCLSDTDASGGSAAIYGRFWGHLSSNIPVAAAPTQFTHRFAGLEGQGIRTGPRGGLNLTLGGLLKGHGDCLDVEAGPGSSGAVRGDSGSHCEQEREHPCQRALHHNPHFPG